MKLGQRSRESDDDDIDKYFPQNQKTSMSNLVIDDDSEDDSKDLSVTVDSPEKHVTAMESYVTFRVNTTVCVRKFTPFYFYIKLSYSSLATIGIIGE